jgi:hypothetical protein
MQKNKAPTTLALSGKGHAARVVLLLPRGQVNLWNMPGRSK